MKRFMRYFISFALVAAIMISILPLNVFAAQIPPDLGNVSSNQMQPGDSSKDSVYVNGTVDFSEFATVTDIANLDGEGFYFGCVTCPERMGVKFVIGPPGPDKKLPVPGQPGFNDTIVEISIDNINNSANLVAKIIAVISQGYIMRKGTMTASPRIGEPGVLVISHLYHNRVGNADWGFLKWGTDLREDPDDDDLVVPGKGVIVPGMTYILKPDAAGNYTVDSSAYETDSTTGDFLYYIDMSTDPETIVMPDDYDMIKYSVDGGKIWDWSTKEKFVKKIPKLLDKGMTLWLSNEVINLKDPGYQDIKQIRFNEIKQRPKLDSVIANYLVYRDQTGATTGRWILTNKGSTTPLNMTGLEVGVVNGDNINFWGIKFKNGEPVLPISSESKTKYSIRTASKHNGDGTVGSPPPTNDKDGTYTAASKSQKITVLSELKPPKYKANYKTETIKLKKGDIIFAGTNPGVLPVSLGKQTVAVLNAGQALYANEKAVTISLSDYLSVNPETVVIWSAATEKKPASAKQVYALAPRAVMIAATLNGMNGKIALGKTYEVLKNNNKWGSSLPKVTASGSFGIRLKSTVKVSRGVETGFAASKPGNIRINYGVYDTIRNKSGIIDAAITPASPTSIP